MPFSMGEREMPQLASDIFADCWNYTLTHKGRANVLRALGHAIGWQFYQFQDLPANLQCQLRRYL
jgi:hypothetical protein